MFSRSDASKLDAWITREQLEVEMWCPLCELNADSCELPDDHEGHWVTASERAEDEAADYAYDTWNDDHWDR
jgi:hypothetical protein